MVSAKTNYWIDIGLAITFILTALTGILKFPGLIFKFGLTYKDLPMKTLSTIHDWSGIIMVLLVLIHLIFHFKWIVVMTKNLFKKDHKKFEQ
jgi:cytochrome b subunit of formate dehydrogenase